MRCATRWIPIPDGGGRPCSYPRRQRALGRLLRLVSRRHDADHARQAPDRPGGAIESDETLFGVLGIDPGTSYPPHRHAAPDVYFVLGGRAECRFGDEVFEADAGSVIRTAPNVVNSFRVLGDVTFRAAAYWYAPGDDAGVLGANLELVDGGAG